MSKLADLAKRLEELGTIPAEAIAAGADYADKKIRSAGAAGGRLHEGNAAVAEVQQGGLSISITRIHSDKGGFPYGIRNDFIARWIAEEVARRMRTKLGGR